MFQNIIEKFCKSIVTILYILLVALILQTINKYILHINNVDYNDCMLYSTISFVSYMYANTKKCDK
jgi:hypothetical protein